MPTRCASRRNRRETQMRRFFTAGALAAAVLLAAATAASAGVPSPSYQLGGFGFGTSYVGTGFGSTGDRGLWQATLATSPAGDLTGTFSLRSNGQQESGPLTGAHAAVASAAAGCGRQQLSLTGTVATADGPMTLTATVTQFR